MKTSFRFLLLRNYLIISILPILLFGIIGSLSTSMSIRREIDQKNTLLVRSLNYEIDEYIGTSLEVLQHVLSNDLEARQPEEIHHILKSAVESFQNFSAAAIIDHSGTIRHMEPPVDYLIGNDVSNQETFNPGTWENGFSVSEPFIDPRTNSPSITLTAANDSVIIAGYLDLRRLREITNKITIGETGYAFIADSHGYLISHPNRLFVDERRNISNLSIFTEGFDEEVTFYTYIYEGRRKLASAVRHPETGWALVVTQNMKESNKPLRNIGILFLTVVTITLALSLHMAFASRRQFSGPLENLMRSAAQIATGRYEVNLEESGIIELNKLILALKRMSSAIRTREDALQHSTEQYKALVEHSNSIIIRWNRDLSYTFFNTYAEEQLGFSKEQIIGKPMVGTTHTEKDSKGQDVQEMLADIIRRPEKYASNENEVINSEGEARWFQWSNKPIYDENGRVAEILSIGTDRTAYKRAEEKISQSLEEKEILLKEIHHRVKNNMQIISSLLNLQEGKMRNPDDLLLFQESESRVHFMSLIHEQLYESENFTEINFQNFINEMISYISDIYLTGQDRIEFSISTDDISLDIDRAIPCALIINELLSNSMKYAFPERPCTGKILVQLTHENGYILTFADNGIGYPEGFDPKASTGLGFQLVNALVDQLGGSYTIEKRGTEAGAAITIQFG